MKKQKMVGVGFILLFALLVCSSPYSSAAARTTPLKQDDDAKEIKGKLGIIEASAAAALLTTDHHVHVNENLQDFSNLLGAEEYKCDDEKDEECLKRRLIAEAHLDYIYTQHHKQP